MIKAISLIFDPAATWDKIVLDNKSYRQVLFFYLIPMIFISVGAQVAGLLYLGAHSDVASYAETHTRLVYAYGVVKLILDFVVVFICAKVIKTVAETFHSRNSFGECVIVIAYSLSPLFLIAVANGIPGMNFWASYGIGIALSVGTMYYGLPRMLLPDPPHAFGLYVISTLLVTGISALGAFIGILVLAGKIKLF